MNFGTTPPANGTGVVQEGQRPCAAESRCPDMSRRSLQHLALYGQIRLPWEPESTLFNTDGQIFSDTGIPIVLFMENYDINRTGYHDTHDTMENIDLDYGSALVAIAIEAVALAANHAFL